MLQFMESPGVHACTPKESPGVHAGTLVRTPGTSINCTYMLQFMDVPGVSACAPVYPRSGVSRGGPEGPRPALRDLKFARINMLLLMLFETLFYSCNC